MARNKNEALLEGYASDSSYSEEESIRDRASRSKLYNNEEMDTEEDTYRPSFGGSLRSQNTESNSVKPNGPSTLKTGFGAKMMAQMGYVKGKGLGSKAQGIVNPIESVLRPRGVGLGSVNEKPSSKSEYEETSMRKKAKKSDGSGFLPSSESGRSTPVSGKRKIQTPKYKTAAEISKDAGGLELPSTLYKLVDMTGPKAREVSSVSEMLTSSIANAAGGATPEEVETMKIAKLARREVENYANEWRSLQDRKAYAKMEKPRALNGIARLTEELDKLKLLETRVEEIMEVSEELLINSKAIIKFSKLIERIEFEHYEEGERLNLDEIVIAAITPYLRQEFSKWDIFKDPTKYATYFLRWRKILRIESKDDVDSSYISEENLETVRHMQKKNASAYESFIHSIWLPKVRSAINNDWDPAETASVLEFIDVWRPILPAFAYVSLLKQVILPKIRASIQEWNPQNGRSQKTHSWIFSWLPLLGDHLDDLIVHIKQKLASTMSYCDLDEATPENFNEWSDLLGKTEWQNILIRHIVPRLAERLRSSFIIDPADQKLDILELVFRWRKSYKLSVTESLLENGFWGKWLDCIYNWLIYPEADFVEISQWYQFWRDYFPKDLKDSDSVKQNLAKGLDLMNAALDEEDGDLSKILKRPKVANISATSRSNPSVYVEIKGRGIPAAAQKVELPVEANYKDIVEDFCMENDLLLIPLRKAHEESGMPLWRITSSPSGKGGILCYFSQDVLYVRDRKSGSEKEEWAPLTLEELLDKVLI